MQSPLPKFHCVAIHLIIIFCLAFVGIDTYVVPMFIQSEEQVEEYTSEEINPELFQVNQVQEVMPDNNQVEEIVIPKEQTDAFPKKHKIVLSDNDYSDITYSASFIATRPISELRELVYPVENITKEDIKIKLHKGGEALTVAEVTAIAELVVSQMPNIPHSQHVIDLLIETCATETLVGLCEYKKSAKRSNYGIAQIRDDTAKDTLWWLGVIRKDVKEQVMKFYDNSMSLKDNLLYNVHFSLAMCLQIYWRRIPDIVMYADTMEYRAIMWKSVYNTKLGTGTVDDYLTRVNALLASK